MDVWKFIQDKLSSAQQVMLLYVLESEGSSPGRQGFKMAVAADESFCGTIGGGIMEHKLVEKAKAMLHSVSCEQQNESAVLLMRQYHDKDHSTDQSGMICLGNQLNAFIPLTTADKLMVEKMITGKQKTIQLSPGGIQLSDEPAIGLQYNTDSNWLYSEHLNQQPVIHIIGGGHVGLALSELMHFLGFYIKIYDDRKDLNTMQQNNFANERHTLVDFGQLGNYMAVSKEDYAVIITFGYRTDKEALKQLLHKDLFYLGLIGSDNKIKTLFKELSDEGISPDTWQHVHAPIGINIYSKTTPEIAVSIAAEIILEKNKKLPTGRNY